MTENPNSDAPVESASEEDARVVIRTIFIKDISFESPLSPMVFFDSEFKPEMKKFELQSSARSLDNDHYEITLTITVAVNHQDKTAFLVEVQQSGVFMIRKFEQEQMNYLLGSYCPGTLFPFARQVVADMTARGGFQPLYLDPIDFDAVYAQQMEQNKQGSDTESDQDSDNVH